MHNIKEAIYENKSKLEGIGEDYQIQVSDVPLLVFKRTTTCNSSFKEVDDAWFLTAAAAQFMFVLNKIEI